MHPYEGLSEQIRGGGCGSKGGIEAEHRGTVRHVFLPSLYSRTGGKEKSGDLSLSRAKVDGGGGALPSSLADAFLKGLISWGLSGRHRSSSGRSVGRRWWWPKSAVAAFWGEGWMDLKKRKKRKGKMLFCPPDFSFAAA